VTFAGEIHLDVASYRLESWGLGLLALALRDLLWEDVPLGFGTARGFNEYRVRLAGVDRFWIEPPEVLAGEAAGLDTGAGPHSFRPAAEAPLDSPEAVAAAMGTGWAAVLASWVVALHRFLGDRYPAAAGRGEETP
jgi:hypothetical protein